MQALPRDGQGVRPDLIRMRTEFEVSFWLPPLP